jgi:GNAT superfamily N-acetyltransferase
LAQDSGQRLRMIDQAGATMPPISPPNRHAPEPFPMFTLSHLTTPPPESLKSQVLQMVVDYFSDLSPAPLTPSNPLYQLYQYVIGFEVHLYLQAMGSEAGSSARLILALDDEDPSTVLGFALYLPSPDDADACTLVYLAVQASHRRKGIARAMLKQMQILHPHAALACVASRVPTFEALGFQVLASRGPQVLMILAAAPRMVG